MQESEFHQAWSQEPHDTHLGTWDKYSASKIVKLLDEFNEWHMFRTLVGQPDLHTFSDVGCATGHSCRFIQKVWPALEYKGFDISVGAIEHAKKLYPNPKTSFQLFDGTVSSQPAIKSDIVLCRDVIHHQPNPLDMLKDLYDAAGKYLILRMRTKEVGETVYDVELSCQYSYGHWVPFIVFNTSELVDIISSMDPKPSKITVQKQPLILGGVNNRYVVKELYYPETGTAETAFLVDKTPLEEGKTTEVTIETVPETKYSAWWIKPAKNFAHRLGL
jgi:SAM-dependent methyltransferase